MQCSGWGGEEGEGTRERDARSEVILPDPVLPGQGGSHEEASTAGTTAPLFFGPTRGKNECSGVAECKVKRGGEGEKKACTRYEGRSPSGKLRLYVSG